MPLKSVNASKGVLNAKHVKLQKKVDMLSKSKKLIEDETYANIQTDR